MEKQNYIKKRALSEKIVADLIFCTLTKYRFKKKKLKFVKRKLYKDGYFKCEY